MTKEHADLAELAFTELVQGVKEYMDKADDAFHFGQGEKAGYYLLVAERFSNELKIRAVTTFI